MKLKHEIILWLFVLIFMLVGGLFAATVAKAAEKVVEIHCKGRDIQLINPGNGYLFATVDFEKGNFRELPSDDAEKVIFYSLDTGKVLVMGDKPTPGLSYMAIYESVEKLHSKTPQYQDNCIIP